jgi:ATP-dependent DNA helicase RecQ
VFGIVEWRRGALLKPLARALQARGSLIPTEHGGLALGGDARDVLKGEAAGADRADPQGRTQPQTPARAGAVVRPTRSAIRCSKRCGRCAAISPQEPGCRPM